MDSCWKKKITLFSFFLFFFFKKQNERGKKITWRNYFVSGNLRCFIPVLWLYSLLVSFNYPKNFIYLKTLFYTFLQATLKLLPHRLWGSLSEFLFLSFDPLFAAQMEKRNVSYCDLCTFNLFNLTIRFKAREALKTEQMQAWNTNWGFLVTHLHQKVMKDEVHLTSF